MHGTPRFPFLWCGSGGAGGGTPAHCGAFRKALQLRYHLLPFVYSLAHDLYRHGRPIARPATFEFPAYKDAGKSYMVGSHLVLGDISSAKSKDPHANDATTYLPPGAWFKFNSTFTTAGDVTINDANMALDEFPVYVRPGAIIPMQQAVVQFTDAIGGVLLVHVYGGADGSFDMVEDDGSSNDYQKGVTLTTSWTYTDSTQALSWKQSGPFKGTVLSTDLAAF